MSSENWWETAVVYQVYIRSFADGNGDGIGDIGGMRTQLRHLSALGVDAIWINPWYPSPMADAGYDVADYCDIEPTYGTLADAEALISEAHAADIKVLLDIVPNHTSDHHEWFQAALRDEPGARDRYLFRPGGGAKGDEPPNNWESIFGGPAWTRVSDGSWYLHLFAPAQPDLNWGHPDVRAAFEEVLAFWFDKGVDGFRIDVAHGLVKAEGLPDHTQGAVAMLHDEPHPAWDQDGVHDIYRDWRTVADRYAPQRVFIAEAWVPGNERLARYLRADELHTAFQFDFLRAPWRAASLRTVIDEAIAGAASVGAAPTWVLSNHDVPRVVTRYSRSQPNKLVDPDWERARWAQEEADHDLGRRRARACALLQLALPGTAYIYQGEELGLEEVEDLPDEVRQDPTWVQSGYSDVGRDGCRVPLPWSGSTAPYGFSPEGVSTWLPQPPHWGEYAVAAQESAAGSFLQLYRDALAHRPILWVDTGELQWLPTPDAVLGFARGNAQCWVNTGDFDVRLPDGYVMVLASDPVHDGLPPDTAAWLVRE